MPSFTRLNRVVCRVCVRRPVGHTCGAETLARAMTIIETAKLNSLDPQAYLADILDRIQDHKINRLDALLPWNWVPLAAAHPEDV